MSNSSPLLRPTLDPHAPDPFRLLVNAVLDQALCIVDLAGRIASWNSGAERLYGYREDEIVGRPLSDLADAQRGPSIEWHELRRLTLATERYEFEYACARKDASTFLALVTVSLLKNDQGQAVSFGFVARVVKEEQAADKSALGAEVRERASPDKTAEIALRSREERYRTLFEQAPIGILYADDKGTYLDANESACAMLGYTRDELVGRSGLDIVVPEEAEHISAALREIDRGAGHEREWRFRRKDGSRFVGNVVATKFPDGTFLGMIRDVTELRAREREVACLTRLYNALSQISQAIVWTPSRDELFRKVCRALVEQGGFRLAWIGRHDPRTHRLLPVAAWGDESGFVANLDVYADERAEGRGPTGVAFRTGRPYVSNDILNDPAIAAHGERPERHGLRSLAVFPIRVGGAVCGTLSVYDGCADVFGEKETALLAEAATDLSFALDNFERDEARRRAEQAALNEKSLNETMIESMPGIVYFYDEARRFLRWNKNFEAVSGFSSDEIAWMHPLDFFRDGDRANVGARIVAVFQSGDAMVEAEFVSKDGSATPYFFTGRRVQFEGRTCLVGMGIDVSAHRRVELRLAESERKYRELVEYANSIILRWSAAGRITFLNEFGQRFFGYTADEIIDRHVIGTIVPSTESTGRDLEKLMDALCASPETFEQNVNECVRRTGERVWIAWTNRVVRDSAGRLVEILSIGSDITERRRAEVSLREAELRYHTLFEETPVGVVVVDPVTTAILECNTQAARQLGYTPDEFSGLTLADFDATAVGETRRRTEQIVLAGRDQFETQQTTRSGEVRDVFASGRLVELGGRQVVQYVCLDVTERKRSERALRLHERAIQAVSQGILVIDPNQPDNPIVFASGGFERMTGYQAVEVIGRNWRLLYGEETDRETLRELESALAEARTVSVEILHYRKDGKPFWNQLTVTPVLGPTGELTHFVGVHTDVTGRRRLEEQYRQSQKMEAVGRLAGGVAHDFNNLLTIISGYSELLLDSPDVSNDVRSSIDAISEAGERAAALTRQLLGFSRQSLLQPKVLDLNEVVLQTTKLLRRLIGEDIVLTTALDPQLGAVKVDPGHLDQVLMNLAVNARDAMPKGGKLTIETRNVLLGDDYAEAHLDCKPGPHAMLAITDTGSGMTPDVQARIFEPFYTTKEVGKGTGLGLAVVFGIVQQSGGGIHVYSEVGRGTVFKIYLPTVSEQRPSPTAIDSRSNPGGTETILLVEDDERVRRLALESLTRQGYNVVAATDGRDALRVVQSCGGPVHLVLTDVVMPNIDGPELVAHLRAQFPEMKVLFMSGYTDDAVVRHGLLEAEMAFIQKPYTPLRLAQKVRQVLDEPATVRR